MPNITVRNLRNEPVRDLDLPVEIFDAPWNDHLIWEVVKAHLAGLRSGTHDVKTRSEVAGSGKKLWKQKHTGRARMGSVRSPIWRKGGTVHGPTPHSYELKVNIKAKKTALRAVLSKKVADGRLLVLDRMEVEAAPDAAKTGRKRLTKQFATALAGLGVKGKALIVDSHGNTGLEMAARNQAKLSMAEARSVNVYDAMNAEWVVLSEAALARVTEVLR